MSNTKLIFIASLLLLILGCDGCDDDGKMVALPQGEECTTNTRFCPPEASCDNGYCVCRDQANQIAPGFCLSGHLGSNNFISYNTEMHCMDTTVMAFYEQDPYDTQWDWANSPDLLDITMLPYNRVNQGISGGSGVCLLVKPQTEGVNVDSIIIASIPIGNSGFGYCPFPTDTTDVACLKIFRGRFVDRNNIEGQLCFGGCIGRQNRPPAAEACYPMSWQRL